MTWTIFISSPVKAVDNTNSQNRFLSQATVDLKEKSRKVWIEHAVWTRNYLYSNLFELENKGPTLTRLLRNQDDIGNLIKPYYGDAAGTRLSDLLKQHIVFGGRVIKSIKNKNQIEFEKTKVDFYRNADEIAEFLNSANPNWNRTDIQKMLHRHLDDVITNTTLIQNKDWINEIRAFDKGEENLINFADTITEGIIKQFPEKF
jgi:hypothetical protein